MHPIRTIIAAFLLLSLITGTGYYAARYLRGADTWLYNAFVTEPSEPILLLQPGEKPPVHRVLIPGRRPYYPPVYAVEWEPDNTERPEAACKLQEFAVILRCLAANFHVQHVGAAVPLQWQDSDNPLAGLMLTHGLGELKGLFLGICGTNEAQAQPTPEQFAAAAIPAENLEGDFSRLPSANTPVAFSVPPVLQKPPTDIVPDFTRDELLSREKAAQHGLSLPLIVRWNEHVLPTLPLRTALSKCGLTPADLHVRAGKSLRMGQRLIPLDENGRTPLGAARALPLPLSAVLAEQPRADAAGVSPARHSGCAVVTRTGGGGSFDAGERSLASAAAVSLLLSEDDVTYRPETRPEPARILRLNPLQSSAVGRGVLVGLCLILLLVFRRIRSVMPRLLRSTLLLMGAAGLCVLAFLWFRQGLWMSLCAWGLCWVELVAAHIVFTRLDRDEAKYFY